MSRCRSNADPASVDPASPVNRYWPPIEYKYPVPQTKPPTPRLRQVSSCESVNWTTSQQFVRKMTRLAAAPASGDWTTGAAGAVVVVGAVVVGGVAVVGGVVVVGVGGVGLTGAGAGDGGGRQAAS